MPDELGQDIGRSPETRVGAWLILAVGVIGFGLGITLWRSRVLNAFVRKTDAYVSVEEAERKRVEAMRGKDSDLDGINDYDESYVFKTSPYLDDSDSDGLKDKAELEAGSDPNCPIGRQCGPAAATGATASASGTSAGTPDDRILKELLNPTPQDIRAMLIQSGVKPEEIEKLDDETLKQLYAQALLEAQAGAQKAR